jgi:hypothetical protein
MKHLLLLAAFGLFASPAFAQGDTATVTATGDGNTATVVQAGGSTATVTQHGDDSDATITQRGGAHSATITTASAGAFDGNGNAIGRNNASILQVGTGSDLAVIEQGRADAGRTVQEARATIEQRGTGSNEAAIRQNTDQSGRNATSEIFQDGFDNTAETVFSSNQRWDDLTRITQVGTGNSAYQLKDDEREGSLIIEQEGASNVAEQVTRKDHARDLLIRQVGEGNTATQDLYKGSYATTRQYGDGNYADLFTSGRHGNALTVIQGNEDGFATSDGNTAELQANDGFNTALIEQYGAGRNEARVLMSDGASLDVLQNGEGNVLAGLGGIGPALVLGGSTLTVDQIGSFNKVHVSQHGGGVGIVSQTGSNNVASIIQS